MTGDEYQHTLLKQIMENQTELFNQIKEINSNLLVLARVEERQVSDRGAMSLLSTDVRELGKAIRLQDSRVQKLESITSGRGNLFRWAGGIAASGITALIVVMIKTHTG